MTARFKDKTFCINSLDTSRNRCGNKQCEHHIYPELNQEARNAGKFIEWGEFDNRFSLRCKEFKTL